MIAAKQRPPPLRFVHVGDLHIAACGEQNHRDFLAIIGAINTHVGQAIDFVVLPGDNADDGTAEQFRVVRDGLGRLDVPWHVIPGDHDFKPRNLSEFYGVLNCRALPYAEITRDVRCIFLDSVSAGSGGPDFRLGEAQMAWLSRQLESARAVAQTAAVFMHTFPSDLQDVGDELAGVLRDSTVALVDTGHTHYNEIATDGCTIYAAVRSTGQVEEGDVGFAFAAIDDGAVSWRFKTLASSWPFVLITSPADHRLLVDGRSGRDIPERFDVHASVWGADVADVSFRIDGGDWETMQPEGLGLYRATAHTNERNVRIDVRATGHDGSRDIDTIDVARYVSGVDASLRVLDAWPERHLLGTRLGPNANGRKW